MGAYIYVTEQDRVSMRKVDNAYVNEEFQEALSRDPSLMIQAYKASVKRGWFRKPAEEQRFMLYHETPAHDGSPYMARVQMSASGKAPGVIAYLHGIITGVEHYKESLSKSQQP